MNYVRKNLLLFFLVIIWLAGSGSQRNMVGAFTLTFGKLNFLAGKPQGEQYLNNENIFLKTFERKTSKTCNHLK